MNPTANMIDDEGKKKHEARIENSGHLLLTALLRVLIFVIIAVIYLHLLPVIMPFWWRSQSIWYFLKRSME